MVEVGDLPITQPGLLGIEGDVRDYTVSWLSTGGVTLATASPLDSVRDTIATTKRLLWLAGPALVALVAGLAWLLAGRALRPVHAVTSRVAAIGSGSLHERVPVPASGDEIAELAATMNAMLARLEDASATNRRLVADASHELRTPLTRIRAELELDGRHPDRADPEATRRSVLRDVAALQRLIDDLLLLARSDAAPTPPSALVDLDDLVLEEAAAFGGIDVRNVSAAQVRGDASALRRVVRNLFDNATRHAAGRVEVRLGEEAGRAVLTVDDDGEGIPAARRAEVFQRFARLDDARTPTEGRTGLGLAIVQTVVAQHGGTVEAGDSPLGGARFTVSLPLHRA